MKGLGKNLTIIIRSKAITHGMETIFQRFKTIDKTGASEHLIDFYEC